MRYGVLVVALLFGVFTHVSASETSGTIDATYKYAQVCQNETCSTYGTINFKPTINGNTPGANAINITDSGITGHAWGNEVGWINFTPTGFGVTINPTTGVLSGTAYGSTGGWINFSQTAVGGGTTVGVTINSVGEFVGWAWISGAYGGWIKFDCGNASTCVKTDWRPIGARASGGGGGGGGSSSGGGGSSSGGGSGSTNTTNTSTTPTTSISPVPVSVITPLLLPTDIPPANIPPANNNVLAPVSNTNDAKVISDVATGDPVVTRRRSLAEVAPVESDVKPIARDDASLTKDAEDISMYRSVSFFGPAKKLTQKQECILCLVIRYNETEHRGDGILKLGIIPEFLEMKLPLSEIFLDGEGKPSIPLDVDATSLLVTAAGIPGIIWGFINLLRFIIPAAV